MRRKTLSALLAGFAATGMFASSTTATGTVMYDAVPDPLPSNVVSLGYQATSTSEFGQAITPASTGPLESVTLTMSSWACQSGRWNTNDCQTTVNADGSLPTFDHPITINIYESGDGQLNDAPGPLIASVTQTVSVPYRPAYDSTNCTNGGYFAADLGFCTNGYAFNVTFDFTGEGVFLHADDDVVVGVAYNTSRYGEEPLESPGPYDSLNVGIDVDPSTDPAVGTSGDNYWDATYLGRTPGFRNAGDWEWDVMIRLEAGTADYCKKGGFEQYGFTNQGQCVASVKANENAGK